MASSMDRRVAAAERKVGIDDAGQDWLLVILKSINGDRAAKAKLRQAEANPASSFHRFHDGTIGEVNRRLAAKGLPPLGEQPASEADAEVQGIA